MELTDEEKHRVKQRIEEEVQERFRAAAQERNQAAERRYPYCAEYVRHGAIECRFCGERLDKSARPIAGVAVGAIFGVVNLTWTCYSFNSVLRGTPAGVEGAIYSSFPGFQTAALVGHQWP